MCDLPAIPVYDIQSSEGEDSLGKDDNDVNCSEDISVIIIDDDSQSSGREDTRSSEICSFSGSFCEDMDSDADPTEKNEFQNQSIISTSSDDDYIFGTLNIDEKFSKDRKEQMDSYEVDTNNVNIPQICHGDIPAKTPINYDRCDDNISKQKTGCLITGVGLHDYSLLQKIKFGKPSKEQNEAVSGHDPFFPDLQMECSFHQEPPYGHDMVPRETDIWLLPTELLSEVESKLSEDGPRLAVSETLGPPSLLHSYWSRPVVKLVVGELDDAVPKTKDSWRSYKMISSRHRGNNKLYESQTCPDPHPGIYRISTPKIYANSLLAMVISCNLDKASCCRPVWSCKEPHLVEDILVDTMTIYTDIMGDISKMKSWAYVKNFVNTESFTYTTQIFVLGTYCRQTHVLRDSVHTDITLIYPKTVVPSDGIDLATAMRNCFIMPSRGLVEIKAFSIAIECHGPRPSRYFKYKLDPLYERMGVVCVCSGDDTHPLPCMCAQQYIETLICPLAGKPHPIAAIHAASLPKMTSVIAYTVFWLIDELTKENANFVSKDTSMKGNNITLQVGNYTHMAGFITQETKHSYSHQPSVFTEIHLSRVLLESPKEIVNCVAQLCAVVLFMTRYGNPDRNVENDQKYNCLVQKIIDFFPALDIKPVPPLDILTRKRTSLRNPLTCDNCGRDKAFVKKGYLSVLVCDTCKSQSLKEAFYTPLVISEPGQRDNFHRQDRIWEGTTASDSE